MNSIIVKKHNKKPDFVKRCLNAHRETTNENIDCANLLPSCTNHFGTRLHFASVTLKLEGGAAKQRDKMLCHV